MATTLQQPSAWRAARYLVGWTFTRQLRGHLLLWVALGLLGLVGLMVGLTTQADRWNMGEWRTRRAEPTYREQLELLEERAEQMALVPNYPPYLALTVAAIRMPMLQTSGLWIFSNWVAFGLFASFLLPLWTLTFATEALARLREQRTLLWLFLRPLPRWLLYLGTFAGMLPWCLLLNVGGFWVLCQLGGAVGRQAFGLYWPAALMGTLAFAALFHLLAAAFRRASILALAYAFFFETIAGNLPGHFKRLSLSFYVRCMMFDAGQPLGIGPVNPTFFHAVEGPVAFAVLAATTLVLLAVGVWVFGRKEYLDLS